MDITDFLPLALFVLLLGFIRRTAVMVGMLAAKRIVAFFRETGKGR